jgi:hypothetical protein
LRYSHGERMASLPFHHYDPFDRMLVAQAVEEQLTSSPAIEKCSPIRWKFFGFERHHPGMERAAHFIARLPV